jgi:hypothetical protein
MSFAVDSDLDWDDDLVDSYEEQPFEEEDFEALGVNPVEPTKAKPGSEDKVSMLAARYAAGLPLWNEQDCYDHGPRERDLMGLEDER